MSLMPKLLVLAPCVSQYPISSKNPSLSHTMYASHPILPQGCVSQFEPEKRGPGHSSKIKGFPPAGKANEILDWRSDGYVKISVHRER